MTISLTYSTFLLLVIAALCNAGLIKSRRHKNDESVETLLAVGLIAKALADHDSPPQVSHCPAPIQVSKVIPFPVYKERIVFVKDKECENWKYHESKEVWGKHSVPPDSHEIDSWRRTNEY